MVYVLIALYVLAGFIVLYKVFKNEDLFTGKNIRFVLGELTGLVTLYFIWPILTAYVFLRKEKKDERKD